MTETKHYVRKEVDVFGNLPFVGDNNVLYELDNGQLYRWSSIINNYVLFSGGDTFIDFDAAEESKTFYVRLATNGALNACTYDNGTAGVGATLTGNANGIVAQTISPGKVDNTVAALNDTILIKNQSPALQNGIYEVTQLGDGSTPFILTRIDGYDETAEIYPSITFVSAGSNNINRYFSQTTAAPTVGTSNLIYAISAAASPVLPVLFVDTVTSAALPSVTYANGTIYTTLPGYNATLTADVNGTLGVINGVNMTSSLRLIIKDQANGAHNGIYTVTNPGSATQRWVLTRAVSDFSMWYKAREFHVTNINSGSFGSIWTATSPVSMSNLNYGITPIVYTQQNNISPGPMRFRKEINPGNFAELNSGNGSYGLLLLPEELNTTFEIVSIPTIHSNGLPLQIAPEVDFSYGGIDLYHGWGPQGFFMDTNIDWQEILLTSLDPVLLKVNTDMLNITFYRGLTQEDAPGVYRAASIFLYMRSFQTPNLNPDWKAWIEFDYYKRTVTV